MTLKPTMIGLDTVFLEQVVKEGGTDARKLLSVQIAGLLRDPSTPLLEREQVAPIVLKLAADEEFDVRKVLSQELRDVPRLAAELVIALTGPDDQLGLEFISVAACVDGRRMSVILQDGDEARQSAIAGRPDLSRDVLSQLIEKGQPGAILILLNNALIDLKDADFRKLYARFSVVPEIMDCLLARIDLPMDIRVTQARRVAGRMKQYVAEFPWAETENTLTAIDESEDKTILDILESSDGAASQSLATYLAEKNLITPALILRAACIGRMRAVEHLLQHLCGYNQQRIHDMMYVRQGRVLQSALTKTGLPTNCVGILQAACSVMAETREEGMTLSPDRFSRRLLEALMTANNQQTIQARQQQVEFLSRYGDPAVRGIARKLKSNLARAA
jgi:uncharacterized protein (DUF2336 family)